METLEQKTARWNEIQRNVMRLRYLLYRGFAGERAEREQDELIKERDALAAEIFAMTPKDDGPLF